MGESSITNGFMGILKASQQKNQVTLARRFHGKLDIDDGEKVEDMEITKKMENVSVSKSDKEKKNKRVIESSSSEEEIIESSRLEKRTTQATAEPSEISFTGAVTSTQISKKNASSKRHKNSPPCDDKFKKPLPKRQRTDPV